MTASIIRSAAPAALAAALAFGLAACSQETEEDLEAAGEELGAAAQEMGEAAAEMTEDAAEAVDDAMEDMDSGRTPAPDGARVYFVNLDDGDTVSNPVLIEFGAEGIGVTEAGDDTAGTGHHHLLIDITADELDSTFAIPNDDNHVHFGDGSTSTEIDLPPGEHTLQLVMGDAGHMLFDPVLASDVITVTVTE